MLNCRESLFVSSAVESICIHRKDDAVSYFTNSSSIKGVIKQDGEQRGRTASRGWLMVRFRLVETERKGRKRACNI